MINIRRACGRLFNNLLVRMGSSSNLSYEDAIQKLNSLQSNKSTIEQIRKNIKTGQKCTNLEDMEYYLMRTGVTLSKLDELSVIHVAGTKGKGSTSAMCESVLRAHGLRTGFYSSPHLVAVRERIRLGGRVVSESLFSTYLHEVYRMLDETQAYEGDMPKYFAFLTVLAYNMFLREKVDVAIIEVGIGGVVDYTNVLRKVPVVGITALGLDHTAILGSTLPEIAAAKAGIMKPGCEAYSVPQPEEAMDVLKDFARKTKCNLHLTPDYNSYTFPNDCKPQLPADLEAYRINASLAIQLAHSWMRIAKIQTLNRRNSIKKVAGKMRQHGFVEIDPVITDNEKFLNEYDESVITLLPKETALGLQECHWPGRYHVIRSDYVQFYLDGAHTKESMEICAQWFKDNNRCRDKILIFSATGDRDAEILLKPLSNIGFKSAYAVIPTAYKKVDARNDNYSLTEKEEIINKCKVYSDIWDKLHNYTMQNMIVMDCVSDALIYIKQNSSHLSPVSVLVTGSLHLVGAALSILDPNLSKE